MYRPGTAMSCHPLRIVLTSIIGLFIVVPLMADDEKPTVDSPQNGTDLGNYVPTTTTWVVVSPTLPKFNGKNTCLAGIYRKEKVISIYAQTENPHVWDLLHAVDRMLQNHPEIKSYIVIHPSGKNTSAARFAQTRNLAQSHNYKQVDVSLCRSPSKLLFDKNTLVKFVYSENRIVKLSKKFGKADQAVQEAAALIETVLQISAGR